MAMLNRPNPNKTALINAERKLEQITQVRMGGLPSRSEYVCILSQQASPYTTLLSGCYCLAEGEHPLQRGLGVFRLRALW